MNHPALVMRLRAAVAAHLPADLQQLLADHRRVAFAAAVAACSPRVPADAVSMLPSTAASFVRPPPLLERIASVWRRRAA